MYLLIVLKGLCSECNGSGCARLRMSAVFK